MKSGCAAANWPPSTTRTHSRPGESRAACPVRTAPWWRRSWSEQRPRRRPRRARCRDATLRIGYEAVDLRDQELRRVIYKKCIPLVNWKFTALLAGGPGYNVPTGVDVLPGALGQLVDR